MELRGADFSHQTVQRRRHINAADARGTGAGVCPANLQRLCTSSLADRLDKFRPVPDPIDHERYKELLKDIFEKRMNEVSWPGAIPSDDADYMLSEPDVTYLFYRGYESTISWPQAWLLSSLYKVPQAEIPDTFLGADAMIDRLKAERDDGMVVSQAMKDELIKSGYIGKMPTTRTDYKALMARMQTQKNLPVLGIRAKVIAKRAAAAM